MTESKYTPAQGAGFFVIMANSETGQSFYAASEVTGGKDLTPVNCVAHEIFRATPNKESTNLTLAAKRLLDQEVKSPAREALGEMRARTDIKSTMGPFNTLPDYKTQYPKVAIGAIGALFEEYNRAFGPLTRANQEWETDYQYTRSGPKGAPVNRWVKVDMVGLPQGFLDIAEGMNHDSMREILRGRIFEIENSLAMYQLLERINSRNGEQTLFGKQFRASLDDLRGKYRKPVALLAVTDQKYQSLKESEFGKAAGESLPDDEVKRLSGFDKLFSPGDFLNHLRDTGGDSEYLLYVRSSDPVAKLKKPETVVANPLLENDAVRRIVKANAITFNIDKPALPHGSRARINDTKAYMVPMGMAYRVNVFEDVFSAVTPRKNEAAIVSLNPRLQEYLISQGVDPVSVNSGEVIFRAKPMEAAYGCYGHVAVEPTDKKHRQELRKGLEQRGPYVIQPELITPVITNETTGKTYTYIDRNYFSTDGQTTKFMGGYRALMPLDTVEAKQKRIHGNGSTVWAEIY